MKNQLTAIIIVMTMLFIDCASMRSADNRLVAANYSDRYHEPSCKIAQKIKPEYKIFFSSPEEAAAAGYEPCKKCPP